MRRRSSLGFAGALLVAGLAAGDACGGLQAHALTASVDAVAFSPDGRSVAAGGSDGAVRLWDPRRLQPIGRALGGGMGVVVSLAFAPGGRTLAAGYSGGLVRLWDTGSGDELAAPVRVPVARAAGGVSLAFTPKGQLVTAASDVRFWNVRTGRQLGSPLARGASVVAVSPDGRIVAAGGESGSVRLWDARTRRQRGPPLRVGGGLHDGVESIAFGPDGRRIAVSGGAGTVRLWDVRTGVELKPPFAGLGSEVSGELAFSPSGRILAAGDSRIYLHDLVTGKNAIVGMDGNGQVAFSPDGRTIAAAGYDGSVRLWNAQTLHAAGKPLVAYPAPFDNVAFSPDGHTIAASGNGTVSLWDTASPQSTGRPLRITSDAAALAFCNSDAEPCGDDSITGIRFSADGSTLTAVNDWPSTSTWSVAAHTQIGDTELLDESGYSSGAFVVSTGDGSVTADVLPASVDSPFVGWERTGAAPVSAPGAPVDDFIDAVALSPDGQILAVAGAWLWLWDTAGSQQMAAQWGDPRKDLFRFTSLAFTPAGQILLAGGSDGTVTFWDPWAHRELGSGLKASRYGSVTSIAFSPDGTTFATAGDDWTIHFWDRQTHDEVGTPLRDDGPVNSIAFSPDGRTLASAGLAGVRLWNAGTHAPIGPLLPAGR